MRTPRKIGIIGGMGPEATVLLMQRIISATDVEDDIDHIPMIVDNNPHIPSRIDALINNMGNNPGPTLANMAHNLELYGAEALAMPCNTAHYYKSYISAAIKIPFFDMIALSVAYINTQSKEGAKIGILASPAVRKLGLFDSALANIGCETCYPTHNNLILTAIQKIKKNGADDKEAQTILSEAANDLIRQNVYCNLIACSELSLIANIVRQNSLTFDTIDILVAEIINFARRGNIK